MSVGQTLELSGFAGVPWTGWAVCAAQSANGNKKMSNGLSVMMYVIP
jgi:hypothetical protein